MSVELRHLRAFVALAEDLSFTRAARRLNVSQQGLSRQIAQLEQLLSVQLLERTTRRVELTGPGLVLLERALGVLETQDGLLRAMGEARDGETGALRLGLFLGGAGVLTPCILRAFRERVPRATLKLRDIGTDELVQPLLSGELDASIVWGPLEDERLQITPLFNEPRVLVVSERNALADAATLTVAQVLDLTHVPKVAGEPDAWEGFWNLVPERNGDEPARGVWHAPSGDVSSQLTQIALDDLALTLSMTGAQTFPGGHFGLRYVPLIDARPAVCSIVTRRDEPSQLIATMRDVAVQVTRELVSLAPHARLDE